MLSRGQKHYFAILVSLMQLSFKDKYIISYLFLWSEN